MKDRDRDGSTTGDQRDFLRQGAALVTGAAAAGAAPLSAAQDLAGRPWGRVHGQGPFQPSLCAFDRHRRVRWFLFRKHLA
jgi:hypothetical protein